MRDLGRRPIALWISCNILAEIALLCRFFGYYPFESSDSGVYKNRTGSRFDNLMSGKSPIRRKNAAFAAALLATGSLVLSPVMMPAFAAKSLQRAGAASKDWLNTFTPSGVDSRLAAKFGSNSASANDRFPFTPAGADANLNRTIIVAARANSRLTAGAVSVRSALALAEPGAGKGLRLSTVDYRLTASKGWQGFALPSAPKLAAQVPLTELGQSGLGKGAFRLDDGKKKPSKFSTNIKLDQNREVAPPARGSAAAGDYKLDVGGSFSISRKIDVTAGVRYSSENDRVLPTPDNRKDSEAVYVGTKIRF